MKNIRNYDEFTNEGILDWGKSVLHKAMTTDKQRDPNQGNTEVGEREVVKDDVKNMKKDSKPVTTKIGRVIQGNNAFIDTKSGEIMAMDAILNEDELNKVIELWKTNKKGAASILKNFAVRERNLQFNLAVGLMMSALCVGTGACIPKLKAQTTTEAVPISSTEVIPTDGVGYKNALLKFYQALGDKVGIGNGDKFIKGSASKEDLFKLFDTLASKKGISTQDFMQQMFTKSHGGNMDMVAKELKYLSQCKADSAIKTVGQIFDKTNVEDMTGVKGFKPFGISSPENAKGLQAFFNDIEGIGKQTITKISYIV